MVFAKFIASTVSILFQGDNMKENNCCENCGINDIIESIALEEAGIAHILNAEGEKIQKALAGDISFEEILMLNRAVSCVIADITNLEIALSNKIKALSCAKCEKYCDSSLTIQVCEHNTQSPICDAIIKIWQGNTVVKSGITDCDGTLQICGLESGCYFVEVKACQKEKRERINYNACNKDHLKFCFNSNCTC